MLARIGRWAIGRARNTGYALGFLAQVVRERVLAIKETSDRSPVWGEPPTAKQADLLVRDQEEVAASLERMGLAGRLASVPVSRLSAGQRRRTALACLVARRAELWLLDEPHAGLDAAGRDDLDATLRDAASAGATVMVASHELERAGALATRVVEIVGGQVRA